MHFDENWRWIQQLAVAIPAARLPVVLFRNKHKLSHSSDGHLRDIEMISATSDSRKEATEIDSIAFADGDQIETSVP